MAMLGRGKTTASARDVVDDDTPPERQVTGPWWTKKRFPRRRHAAGVDSNAPGQGAGVDQASAGEQSPTTSPAEFVEALAPKSPAKDVSLDPSPPEDPLSARRSSQTASPTSGSSSTHTTRSSAPSSTRSAGYRSPSISPIFFSGWPRALHEPFQTVARVPGRLRELIGLQAEYEQALNILYKLPAADALAALQASLALDVIDATELVLAQLYDTRDMLN